MGRDIIHNLQKELQYYITTAFKYEAKFIIRFWGMDTIEPELDYLYMSSERTLISITTEYGQIKTTTTIRTAEFIDWCEEVNLK